MAFYKKLFLSFTLLTLAIVSAQAKIKITKLTCNNQSGLAVVEDGGKALVGWQMLSDEKDNYQTAYKIQIVEKGTELYITKGKKIKSSESQFVALPSMQVSKHGYLWRVKVWDKRGKTSEWSEWQQIHIASSINDAKWIGAITSADAKIKYKKWPNTSFKSEEYQEAWDKVDTLSAKSIVLKEQFKKHNAKVVDAHVIVSGLGQYKLKINDQQVSDAEFAPLWTDYNKTIYYNVYDVTSELASSNADCCVEVMLGNGMYNVQRGERYAKFQASYGAPKLLFKMIVNYDDGTTQTVTSDESWQWALSPVTFNSIYGGESYNACLETPAPAHWSKAVVVEKPEGELIPQTAPAVKIMERYGVKSWQYLKKSDLEAIAKSTKRNVPAGTFVCDMGQNLAGFPEIKVTGKPGQKITLVVSEKLTAEGACNQRETGRQHYYEYTIGAGESSTMQKYTKLTQTWHPNFSYYGFRYIQVEGAVMKGEPNPQNLPVLEEINSCFIYNSAEEYSDFDCNNRLFTQTHRLIERAQRSNMQSVFTDCPHREKLGWLEQVHLNGKSLLFNYDLTTFAPKVMRDIRDAQKDNGMVPTIAPQYVEFGSKWGDFDDSPEWGSTLVIMPFMYYEHYGDSTLIINNYKAMCRYADYLKSRSKDGIVSHGLGDWYDYQENAPAGYCKNTPIPLVATAHYIYDLQLICRAAKMMGNKADLQKYEAELQSVVNAFNNEFYNDAHSYYGNNSQCSNALPLFLGICGDNASAVLENLLKDIENHGGKLTTGDVGNRYLIQALSKYGFDDVVYRMFDHYQTPGYGYQIEQEATTLTEQWNPRHGTSLNHFMMGQIDEWLFASLAGIRNAEGTYGLRDIVIKPQFPGDLRHVSAKTKNLYGTISVSATPQSAEVEIPIGCRATVILPNGVTQTVGSGTHTIK